MASKYFITFDFKPSKWTMGLSFGKGIKEVKQINDTEVTEKTVSGRGFDISIPRFLLVGGALFAYSRYQDVFTAFLDGNSTAKLAYYGVAAVIGTAACCNVLFGTFYSTYTRPDDTKEITEITPIHVSNGKITFFHKSTTDTKKIQ
jgi:hypothetical protein